MTFAKASLGSTFYSKKDDITYKSIQKFTNKYSTTNDITPTNNKTFKTSFSYLLVENTKTHERYLGYFGDVMNETPTPITFTGDIKITLDDSTFISMPKSSTLVDELDSGTKKRGYAIAKLNSKKQPKQIKIELNKPLDTYQQQGYGKKIVFLLHAKNNA